MKVIYLLLVVLLIPVVFAQECDGCKYNGICIEKGTQKIINQNTFYCGKDSVLRPVRLFGTGCEENYECISFYCKANMCDDLEFGTEFEEYSKSFVGRINKIARNANLFLLPIVILIALGIIATYILLHNKGKRKTNKREGKKVFYTDKTFSDKRHGKLEKDIEKSFEDVKKALK